MNQDSYNQDYDQRYMQSYPHPTHRPPQSIVSDDIQHPATSHHGMPANPDDAPHPQWEYSAHEHGAEPKPSESSYTIAVDGAVVEKIAARAVRHIDGVVGLKGGPLCTIQENLGACPAAKGARADISGNEVCIEVPIILKYGTPAESVFEAVKSDVIPEVERLTGLKVKELVVRIASVMDSEEIARWESKPTAAEAAGNMAHTMGSTLTNVAETVVSTVKAAHAEAMKTKPHAR